MRVRPALVADDEDVLAEQRDPHGLARRPGGEDDGVPVAAEARGRRLVVGPARPVLAARAGCPSRLRWAGVLARSEVGAAFSGRARPPVRLANPASRSSSLLQVLGARRCGSEQTTGSHRAATKRRGSPSGTSPRRRAADAGRGIPLSDPDRVSSAGRRTYSPSDRDHPPLIAYRGGPRDAPSTVIETDVVVVGAGPTGLYGAYYAGFRGLSTVVVDVLPQVGGQVMALYPEKQIRDVAALPSHPRSRLRGRPRRAGRQPTSPPTCWARQAVTLDARRRRARADARRRHGACAPAPS